MVRTDSEGRIWLHGREVTQRDAITIAAQLAEAVQTSIYRNQVGTTRYHSSEGILERQETKLGKSITALRRVFA